MHESHPIVLASMGAGLGSMTDPGSGTIKILTVKINPHLNFNHHYLQFLVVGPFSTNQKAKIVAKRNLH